LRTTAVQITRYFSRTKGWSRGCQGLFQRDSLHCLNDVGDVLEAVGPACESTGELEFDEAGELENCEAVGDVALPFGVRGC
jgi:hypothetical protein